MNDATALTLPQLDGSIFLSEAGLETDLIFHHNCDLPSFATHPLRRHSYVGTSYFVEVAICNLREGVHAGYPHPLGPKKRG